MLRIYKTNRIELITELFAKEIFINPPPVTEEISVCVNNYFLGKWIRDQITSSNKISALYEIKSTSNHIEQLVNGISENIVSDQWEFENLRWIIIFALQELGEFEESKPLNRWISKFRSSRIIDLEIYTLVNKISAVFNEYFIYRPEIINHWSQSNINSKILFKGTNIDQRWQPILFKLLEANLKTKPICLYMMEIINNIENLESIINNSIPDQNYIFANNNMTKLEINFYTKISKYKDVNIYLLSPGYNLWERINIEAGTLSFKESYNNYPGRLEDSENMFIKNSANFEQLIEETISTNKITADIKTLYIDPTINNNLNSNELTILNQLQKRIVNGKHKLIEKKNNDQSILFIEHLNILNQLEFIREDIIKNISNNSDLNFSDICLASPNTKDLKPYLNYIFNNNKFSGLSIPFFESSVDYKQISEVYSFLYEIIDISSKRISIDELDSLLNNPISQKIFDYGLEEKDEIISVLEKCGFDYGIDSYDRHGEYRNCLTWCIERITLGLIYDEDFSSNKDIIKPYIYKTNFVDLHKWILIIWEIINDISSLKGCFKYNDWIAKIKGLSNKWAEANNELTDEINNINLILDGYNSQNQFEDVIEINVIKELLDSLFDREHNNPNYRNNEILVSDLKTASLVPHKIIYMLDMNENKFPRKETNLDINIINNSYCFGDQIHIDKERSLLIEILMSCRKKLVISWVCFDESNNTNKISQPISQMKSLISDLIYQEEECKLIKTINTNNSNLINMDKNNEFNHQYSLVAKIIWNNKLHESNNYRLSDLLYWIGNPQIFWLNTKNIYLDREFNKIEDGDKISNLQKYQLLNKLTTNNPITDNKFQNLINEIDLKEELINSGIIAPKNSILLKETELSNLLNSLNSIMESIGNIKKIQLKSQSNKLEYFISEGSIIQVNHSNINLQKKMEAWIRLLFIASNQTNIKNIKLIYRKENTYKSETIKTPKKEKIESLMYEYINIFKNSKENCLPVPPESSYKYIQSLILGKDKNKSFVDSWIGNNNYINGERNKPEMRICFGSERNPEFFLENDLFKELALKIYEPLVIATND